MIIVGVPYTESGLIYMDDITGGTPYGASTLAKGDGSRQPSENELKIARFAAAVDPEAWWDRTPSLNL